MADNITTEQAEQIAAQFLQKHRPTAGKRLMKMVQKQPLSLSVANDATAYYVFNVGSNEGFVMVSGSNLAPRVLGYADKGAFIQDSIPSNLHAWLQGYADQIAYLERTGGRNEAPRLNSQREAVIPLLNSTWGQDDYFGGPYHYKCPIDPETGYRCVTGCVATALAQVINYYKYPSHTIAPIPAYITQTKKISMPEIGITTIDWDNMLDSYDSSATTEQKNAVAQLMLLCGQAVEMDYDYLESGANTINDAKALQKYFGYDKTVRALERNAFSTSEWETLLYEEVASGRPVLFGGSSTGGGHSFVIDGYSSDGLFHINWGWEGQDDGYFAISVLNPYNNTSTGSSSSKDGYSFNQRAIVGIQHGTSEVIPELFTVTGIEISGERVFTRTSATENFTGVSITPCVINITSDTHEFHLGLGLYDSNEELLLLLDGNDVGDVPHFYGGSLGFTDLQFGADLVNGDYYIVPVSASENSNEWEPCWRSNVYYIKATISDNTLTLTEPSISLNGMIQATGTTKVGHVLPLKGQIVNSGSFFNDYVYLFVDGVRVGGRAFEVQEGETANLDIDFIPTSTGRKTLYLGYSSDEMVNNDINDIRNYVPFAIGNVTVTEDNSKLDSRITIINSTDGILPDNKAMIKVRVTNTGDDYDNVVRLVLYEYNSDDMQYYGIDGQTQHLALEKGTTSTLNFEFTNIERQQRYLLSFQYLRAGNWAYDLDRSVEFEQSNTVELSATPASGEVLAGSYVVLNAKPASAKIFYTIDGTEPSENSLVYDSPILIDRELTIKAFASKKNFEKSEIFTKTYTIVENSEADFGNIEVALVDKSGSKKVHSLNEIESIYIDYSDTEPPVVEVERVSSNGCDLTVKYTISDNVDHYYANLSNTVSEYGSGYTSSRQITYTWLKPDTKYYVSALAIGKNGRRGDVVRKQFSTSSAPYSNYVLYRNEFYQLRSAVRTTNNGTNLLYLYIDSSNYVVFSYNGSCSWSGTYNVSTKPMGGIKLSSKSKVTWGDGKLTISGSGSYRTIDFDLDTGGGVYITGHYYGKVQ